MANADSRRDAGAPAATKASAAPTLTPAAARRMHVRQVRAAVRTQLAESQRHRREELSQALGVLHQQLQRIRSDTRTRLREIGLDAAARRTARKSPLNTQ